MEVQVRQHRPVGGVSKLSLFRASPSASIAERVFRTLRSAIVTMRLKPGEAVSEQEIARQFAVSRQPVREAFIKLSEDGLVRVVPQRGTFVMKISVAAVTNARFVREAVECSIARKAATGLSKGDLDMLASTLAEQSNAERRGDAELFFTLDELFHRTLATASGCAYAWKVIESAKTQMDRVRFLSVPEATPMSRLILQHGRILDGVLAYDGDLAATAMQTHLREILSSLPRLTEKFPDMFDAESGAAE
jgi:DNA-binding GntR family transcriptional regulator